MPGMPSRHTIEWPERFSFETRIPVQVKDINYGNHLGHDRLISLLHEARIRFLQQQGFSEIDAGGAGLILTDLACNYLAEVRRGEELCIEVAVTNPGRVRCDFIYRVSSLQQGKVVAEACTGMVFYDYAGQRVTTMPDAFRDAFFRT